MTDSTTLSSIENSDIKPENDNQVIDLESDNSNTLSTNNDETSFKQESKNQTELTSKSDSLYYKGSYDVTLKDSNNNATLSNKEINFVINNAKYTVKTNDYGVASVNLTLTPGKYAAIAYFSGDDEYLSSNNVSSTIEILSTIKVDNITKYYKGSTQYSATFFDSQGNALANRDVTITVNGKSYTKKTDGNGIAKMPIDLKPGTYKVIATDPSTGYKISTTFKILLTISASNIKKVVGDSKKFTANFLKSDGKALANTYIKFKIKGKVYKVKTNAKGQASLPLKKFKKGTYKVICYNKDGFSKTFSIKVYNKVSTKFTTQSYTFLKSDSKKIKVTLSNSLGYALTSGKIIKIRINGKTYSKKTNSKGVAYLKLTSLKKGVYTVKYSFDGTSHYKKSSASNKVTILTTKSSIIC